MYRCTFKSIFDFYSVDDQDSWVLDDAYAGSKNLKFAPIASDKKNDF